MPAGWPASSALATTAMPTLCAPCAAARPGADGAGGAADAKLAVDVALRRAVDHAGCGSSRLRSLAYITLWRDQRLRVGTSDRLVVVGTMESRFYRSTLRSTASCPRRRRGTPWEWECRPPGCCPGPAGAEGGNEKAFDRSKGRLNWVRHSAAQGVTETAAVSCLFRIFFTNRFEDVLLTPRCNSPRAG